MTNTRIAFLLATIAGCGPTFDPASLINTTRVLGARVEIEGAPDRASPLPGETADVTWLVTAPDAVPPLGWAFTVCTTAACEGGLLAQFEGTDSPPRLAIAVPSTDVLGSATSLFVYGEICDGVDSLPTFDRQSGVPGCSGEGTTVSLALALQRGDEANHNPIADRAFTFDGQPWPAGDDPCSTGPRVSAGTKDHVLGTIAEGTDREPYTAMVGGVATPSRESLQISQFTTAGKLASQFSFVEAADTSAETSLDVTWEAPVDAQAVTFTFVTRDNRGGTDWTTRAVCVEP